jgi:hypothetical protein
VESRCVSNTEAFPPGFGERASTNAARRNEPTSNDHYYRCSTRPRPGEHRPLIGDRLLGAVYADVTTSGASQIATSHRMDLPRSGRARLARFIPARRGPLFRPSTASARSSRHDSRIRAWPRSSSVGPWRRASTRLAAKAGKSEQSIMKQTGQRSVSVVRRSIRDAELFDGNAAAGIGL